MCTGFFVRLGRPNDGVTGGRLRIRMRKKHIDHARVLPRSKLVVRTALAHSRKQVRGARDRPVQTVQLAHGIEGIFPDRSSALCLDLLGGVSCHFQLPRSLLHSNA